tara:strand:- start:1962 stop:2207 length:246 start_codon:yes stop_codon:yes gene_type:complete
MKTILFEASDCGYEHGWIMQIYELDGKLYLFEDSSDCGYYYTETKGISQEDALELMLEHAEYEDEEYLDNFHSCAWICRVA